MRPKSTLIFVFVVALCLWQTSLADKPNGTAEDRIRRALQGEHQANAAEDGAAEDGVLEDVLDVIRQHGSILDGTAFDNRQEVKHTKLSTRSRRAAVAEQLLKSSRLLESLGNPDEDRLKLIERMRGEAVTLLSE